MLLLSGGVLPLSCLGSALTEPMWAGGVAALSCFGSILGCTGSAASPGVAALDPPGVAYVLA